MGCGSSTPRKAIESSEQDKVTPETFGNKLAGDAPEQQHMEDDASSTKLIDGEYTKVNAMDDYSRAETPEPAEQAGVGTWGSGDRFIQHENGVPGAKYDLPEVTGTDVACAFGKMTADRFVVVDNGVPGPKYDLPDPEDDACNAVFGKMTADRFVDHFNSVPGPGAYAAPKRFPDEPWSEPCFAMTSQAPRVQEVEDVTKDTFAKYDVEKSEKAQSKALKAPTSSFGKKTSGRFTAPKKKLGPIYNVKAPKWGGGKAAGGSFGTATASRFRVKRNSYLGGPGGYNPGSTFGGKSKFGRR